MTVQRVEAQSQTLEEWASTFGGTAILGFVSALLVGGKFVHFILQRRGLIFGTFIIPPAIISGMLGLVCFAIMECFEEARSLTSDLRTGLDYIRANLINFVFASLILGLTCARSNSQHNLSLRGIATSILHEGMPMIIYSQILMWGQSTVCLTVLCILNYFNYAIPDLFPAMIPLGIESGSDGLIRRSYSSFWDEQIVQEAESLGIIAVSVVGILMFTFKPYFISRGWLGAEYQRDSSDLRQATGLSEAFERGGGSTPGNRGSGSATGGQGKGIVTRSFSSDALYKKETPRGAVGVHFETPHSGNTSSPARSRLQEGLVPEHLRHGHSGSGLRKDSYSNIEEEIEYEQASPSASRDSTDHLLMGLGSKSGEVHHSPYSSPSGSKELGNAASGGAAAGSGGVVSGSIYSGIPRIGHASLGSHLSLIALTVFLSFGIALLSNVFEMRMHFTHHIVSGIRMFKLSMCSALVLMTVILQRSTIRFNREWFMRLCGLMLDMLFISALSKSLPQPRQLEATHYVICSIFVGLCLLWNVFCFLYVARQLFPNYWYERAVTLTGDAMGHCYTGLLFARTLDPTMETPVPAAYAYKLMLFFMPSSGAKNSIVVMMASRHGIASAWLVCFCVVVTWILIFDGHFKHRFVGPASAAAAASGLGSSSIHLKSTHGDGSDGVSESSSLLGGLEMGVGVGSSINSEDDDDLADVIASGISTGKDTKTPLRRVSSSVTSSSNAAATLSRAGGGGAGPSNALLDLRAIKVQCSEPSSILTSDQMSIIASYLSDAKSSKTWKLSYSMRQHGASLHTLIHQTSKYNTYRHHSNMHRTIYSPTPAIIVIEDSWGYVFGGYISPGLEAKKGYYGNGESFVFSVVPQPQVYRWTGLNELFVTSTDNCFAMGGGGEGFAIQLDDELDTGVSNKSTTFHNQMLSSVEFFKCLNVEVWVLETNAGFSV